jgi:hypothetical protein
MKKILYFVLFAAILISCEQEDPPVPQSPETPIIDPRQPGEYLAWKLSSLVTSREFRSALKARIMERFDGDNNALLAMLMEESGESLAHYFKNNPENLDINRILQTEPQLQIALPDLSDIRGAEWDIDNHTPIVVYRSPDMDLTSQTSITAYKEGVPLTLSLRDEPDELVLVVSHNERTIVVPRGKSPDGFLRASGLAPSCSESSPVYQSEEYTYYLKSSFESCYVTSVNGLSGEGNCDREIRSYKDHVVGAKFTTMNYMREAEHFLDGNPEVYFIVTLASKNPSGFTSLRKSYPSSDRSEWKDCGLFKCVPEWHDHAQPVFNWDPETFGDLVRYDWFEEDFSSGKVEITLGLTSKFEKLAVSGNVKITINKKDYFLDQDFVYYCDPADGRGTLYNTGKLQFKINHQ